MQTGARLKSLQPLIPALKDVEAAIAYYRDTLGFELAWKDASPASLAILSRGDVEIFLTVNSSRDLLSEYSLRIGVENIEALYEEYSSKNAIHPDGQLTTKPWGLKEFTIHDLNGVCIAFHEPPKADGQEKEAPNMALETERMRLVPLARSHLYELHAIYSDPAVMAHWHTPTHSLLGDSERLLSEKLATSSWWLMKSKQDERAVGLIGSQSVEDSKPAGLGYILHSEFQGKGLAQEGGREVIRHLFSKWNSPYIELWIYDDNEPSIRLAERLGFTFMRSFDRSGPDGISRKKNRVYWLKQAHWWKVGAVGHSVPCR